MCPHNEWEYYQEGGNEKRICKDCGQIYIYSFVSHDWENVD